VKRIDRILFLVSPSICARHARTRDYRHAPPLDGHPDVSMRSRINFREERKERRKKKIDDAFDASNHHGARGRIARTGRDGRLCLRKPSGCNRKATTGGEAGGELHLHLKLAQREIGIPPERTETQRGIVGIAQVVAPPSSGLDSLPSLPSHSPPFVLFPPVHFVPPAWMFFVDDSPRLISRLPPAARRAAPLKSALPRYPACFHPPRVSITRQIGSRVRECPHPLSLSRGPRGIRNGDGSTDYPDKDARKGGAAGGRTGGRESDRSLRFTFRANSISSGFCLIANAAGKREGCGRWVAAATAFRVTGMLGVQIFIYKRNHVYVTQRSCRLRVFAGRVYRLLS